MIITYKSKKIKNFKTDTIKAVVVDYEISEEDMVRLSEMQPVEYTPTYVGLSDGNGMIDLVIDNIELGRIIEGGLTNKGKYILSHYMISEGLEEFLKLKFTT